MKEEKIPVARIGKTVGLRGEMRLNLLSDFPEQFKKGVRFMSDRGDLTIAAYNPDRGTVRFEGIDDVDAAKPLTNAYLYTTKADSEKHCHLGKDEYFWYQIIGLDVMEEGQKLGRVASIERMAGTDYLTVKTAPELVKQDRPKTFLIPYIDRYIEEVDLDKGEIHTKDARRILEAS